MREAKELEEAYNTFARGAHIFSVLSREHSDCIAYAAILKWVLGDPKYSVGIELIKTEIDKWLKNPVSA